MMKLLSTCFLTAALYGTEAQADTSLPAATPFAGVDKKLPMLELLPVGQVLPKVSLSRYEGPRLSMLLTASSVTVAAPQEIAANILNVYLYGKTTRPPTFSRRPPLIFWIKTGRLPYGNHPQGRESFRQRDRPLPGHQYQEGHHSGSRSNHHPHGSTQQVTIPFMKNFPPLLLALAGSLACSGANGVPSHIVQPPAQGTGSPPGTTPHPAFPYCTPLTEEETARRERELAPVPTAGLKEDGEKAIQTYSAQEKTVDGRIQEFRQQHQVAGNTPRPGCGNYPLFRSIRPGGRLPAGQFPKKTCTP